MLKVALAVLVGVLLRILIGVSEYSGQADPPRFGDLEAQRHWIEVTSNLPISMWYVDSEHHNLGYWPLDYPPLTAYHSMLCGKVAYALGLGEFFELHTSRGLESEALKWFMRGTVLVSDVLICFSAFVFYWSVSNASVDRTESSRYLLVTLVSAPHIFVDHSHFQYNCVAIGLVVWSVNFLYCGYHALSVISIISAVFFKQTMLYFAPALAFAYFSVVLNAKGGGASAKIKKVACLGSSAILATLALLSPFILDSIRNPLRGELPPHETKLAFLVHIAKRVVPIWRGAWENHVASFWFANVFVFNLKKWAMISQDNLGVALRVCTTSTILGFLPACLGLLRHPSRRRFEIALVASSLSFFLFSWQVHEKSVILPLTPGLLLMDVYPWLSLNLIIVSSFSLVTLSVLDKTVPYLVVFGLFSVIVSFQVLYDRIEEAEGAVGWLYSKAPVLLSSLFSLMLVCHYLIPPPPRYPWLHEFLNALVSAWVLFSLLIICTVDGGQQRGSGGKGKQRELHSKDTNIIL